MGSWKSSSTRICQLTVKQVNSMKKSIVSTIIASIFAFSCNAASIAHTTTVIQAPTDWLATNSIPQFDPALGTLTNVVISTLASSTSTLRIENRDSAPAPTATASSEVKVLTIVSGYPTTTSTTNSHVALLPSFDGVVDFSGASGFTVVATSSASYSVSVPEASFIGTGTVPLSVAANAKGRVSGVGDYAFTVKTSATATVVVTYGFIPKECP